MSLKLSRKQKVQKKASRPIPNKQKQTTQNLALPHLEQNGGPRPTQIPRLLSEAAPWASVYPEEQKRDISQEFKVLNPGPRNVEPYIWPNSSKAI